MGFSGMTWAESAACRADDRNWLVDESKAPKATRELVAVCDTCRVSRECLSAAMVEERGMTDVIGVRGGLTVSERKSLRRMLKVSA